MESRGMQVLVVDAHSAARTDLHRVLEELGCLVLCANDARAAQAVLTGASSPIDVAVVDYGLAGRDLIRELRERDRTIRIVVTVAEDFMGSVPEGNLALRRPISTGDLAQIVIALRERL